MFSTIYIEEEVLETSRVKISELPSAEEGTCVNIGEKVWE